ncbi:MAG TPA: type VII secretion protein EccB, partial [Pilimelia sp.]|nr:type VII secretion protein EccB [Pilimelia sp.]
IWHGRRHVIQRPRTVVPALFGAASATPAGTAWLNSLPAGADIARIAVARRDEPSSAMPDRRIGTVLMAETGSGPQHYLVLNDGLAPITPLQEAILRAEFPAEPVSIPVSVATSAPVSARRPASGDVQPPATTPRLVTPAGGEALCAVTRDAATPPAIWVGGQVAGLDTAVPTAGASPDGVPLADRVFVPGGQVATVRAQASPLAPAGPYYVITDLGIRYAVPTAAVLETLGYPAEQAVDVPAALVSRLPAGPTLDPAAATRPATAGAGG